MSASTAPLRWWTGACVVALLVAILSIRLGAPDRHRSTVDLLDEGAHFAYVVALQHHHIPAWGDLIDQRTMRLEDCLGVAGQGARGCDRHERQPSTFGALGYSYEAQQPPLGYLPYVLTTDAGTSPQAAIDSARRGGMIWTAVAAMLLVLIAAAARVSLPGLVVLQATCLLSPVFVHAAATVNNDAAGVAAGSLVLLAAAVFRPGWRPFLGLAAGLLVGVVVGLMKAVYGFAPLALVLAAFVSNSPARLGPRAVREFVRTNSSVLGMLLGATVSSLGWIIWQNVRARVPSSVVLEALLGFTHASHLRPSSVARGLASGISLLYPYNQDAPVHFIWDVVFFGTVAAVIVLRSCHEDGHVTRSLALGATGGLVALATAWTVVNYLQGHFDAYASARYALALMPLFAMVVARAAGHAGLVILGVALPAAAVLWQLTEGPA